MYKVHYFCDGKILQKRQYSQIPDVGDEIRLQSKEGQDRYYKTLRRVFCLDEVEFSRDPMRVNIEVIDVT